MPARRLGKPNSFPDEHKRAQTGLNSNEEPIRPKMLANLAKLYGFVVVPSVEITGAGPPTGAVATARV